MLQLVPLPGSSAWAAAPESSQRGTAATRIAGNVPDATLTGAAATSGSAGNGTLASWGANDYGQLGNGSTAPSSVPVYVGGLTGITAAAGTGFTGYAVDAQGTAWSWGRNDYGQMGNGSTANSSVPRPIYGISGVKSVAGGRSAGYALESDGTVWSWGYNAVGELGTGSVWNSDTPVQVTGLTNVTSVSAGYEVAYALRSDGTVWAWGSNTSGQLGNGTTTNSLIPVQVTGLTDVVQIAAGGGGFALARRTDGTVWGWGANGMGELGHGTWNDAKVLTPVQVSDLTSVVSIAAGYLTGFAARSDGTVWAWGYSETGSLGDGNGYSALTPVQANGLTNVTAVAASLAGTYGSAYALRSDGSVWAWGDDTSGALGDGSTTNTAAPVQVAGIGAVAAISGSGGGAFALGGVMSPVGGALSARENSGGANFCETCWAAAARAKRGDPVDTATGAYSEASIDLEVSDRGPQVMWARSYESDLAADDGPLGFGWHVNYGAHLVIDAATGNVVVSQENGSEVGFQYTAGAYTAPPRVQATLARNSDGTYTFVRQATDTLTFTADGLLMSIADRNGETTHLTYASGRLATVASPSGRTLTITYTGSHITAVADPIGQTVSYTYDQAGDMTSSTGPDGATTTFGYDSAHHLTTVLDPAQQQEPAKHPMTMVYDSQGRVTSQTDALGRSTSFVYTGDAFSAGGGTTVVTDPAGHQQFDQYYFGLRAKTVVGYGTASAVTSTFSFDPGTLGVTSTSVSSADDPVTHWSSAAYNTQGLPTAQVDGLGREVDTTYNSFGEPLTVSAANPSAVGPSRITTSYAYDDKGNLLSVSQPLYTSATAFTNRVTTYQREDAAHPQDVTGVVDPLGNVTTNTYTPSGDLASTTSPQGRETTYTYDAIGRRLTTVTPKGNVAGAAPAQFTTTYAYDGAGRVLSTSVATTGAPLVSSQTYDADGRVLTQTDALNRVTTYGYDLAGEPISVTRPDGSTQTSTYWPDGALKTQVDGDNNTTSYAEDALGRRSAVTDALGRTTSYTYDATGAVLTVTDPEGQVTTNSYDSAGELTSTTYSDGVTPTASRSYNGAGLQSSLVDGTGTTSFTYDSLGRLITETAPGGTVKYGYNLRGQVTSLTYPNNKKVTRVYEADGALTSSTDWSNKKTTFTYDQNEAWTGGTAANSVTTTIGYDNPGRVTSTTFKKGTTTLGALTYTNDAASQITQETTTSLGASRTFTLDSAGRLTGENTTAYAYDNADQLTTNGTTTQAYDAAGQLTTAVTGSTSTTYAFDSRGNRTTATTGTAVTTYTYDQANRLTGYTRGSTTAAYTYNGDGLRASKTVAGVTTKFVYDTAEGLPLILSDGANYYLYGPDGIPYAQITTSGVTSYLQADQLGSIRLITNASGASAGTATYTAYGTRTTTGTASPFGFAGQYTDAETGLQWLRARYYDPTTAQFLTVDPLAAVTGARYSYASGNPISGADPSGLCNGFWGCVGNGLTVGIVNFGRGASFGLSDKIANAISPGASCTVEQNVPMQIVGGLADSIALGGIGGLGEASAAEEAGADAKSAIAGRDLARQLASEQQMGEVGRPIFGAGTDAALRDAERLAQQYGGAAADWAKMTSTSYRGADGFGFATHWYENPAVGRFEFKVKFE